MDRNNECLTNNDRRNAQIVEFLKIHLDAADCKNTQKSPSPEVLLLFL